MKSMTYTELAESSDIKGLQGGDVAESNEINDLVGTCRIEQYQGLARRNSLSNRAISRAYRVFGAGVRFCPLRSHLISARVSK
jgi:hypothetical protein